MLRRRDHRKVRPGGPEGGLCLAGTHPARTGHSGGLWAVEVRERAAAEERPDRGDRGGECWVVW